jgi:formiminotetrahydrofolate cyclodeaminase
MADLGSRRVDEALAALSSSDHPDAAGVASAIGAAAAAALLELSAGLAAKRLAADGKDEPAERQLALGRRAAELRELLLSAADEDAAAYAAVSGAADAEARASSLDRASEPPLAIAVHAAEVASAAGETASVSGEWDFQADAIVAARLAAAAAESAAALVAANAGAGSGDPRIERARDAAGEAAVAARRAAGPARA